MTVSWPAILFIAVLLLIVVGFLWVLSLDMQPIYVQVPS